MGTELKEKCAMVVAKVCKFDQVNLPFDFWAKNLSSQSVEFLEILMHHVGRKKMLFEDIHRAMQSG